VKQAVEERIANERAQARAEADSRARKWREDLEKQQRESRKEGLVSHGVLCVSTYIQELCDNDEIDSDALEDDDWKAGLEDAVRRKIQDEFDGSETYEKAKQVAREIVDEEVESD
jgi:hypothetical protein